MWVRTIDRKLSSAASALDSWMKLTIALTPRHRRSRRVDVLAQPSGDHVSGEQHIDQRVVELAQDAHRQAGTLGGRQSVRPEPREPVDGIFTRQAAVWVGPQQQPTSWAASPWWAVVDGDTDVVITSPRARQREPGRWASVAARG